MNFNNSVRLFLSAIIFLFLSMSCSGEDRSGERPLAPVVQTLSAFVEGDSCVMNGLVTESHNSALRECGFVYGMGDTLSVKMKADYTDFSFSIVADSLANGEYYCVAYARNGISTSYGDTLNFIINK